MGQDLADHVFGHCVAVLMFADLAEEAARDALRRGPRTVTAALAQARYVGLMVAEQDIASQSSATWLASPALPGSPDDDLRTVELTEVARRLAATRPAGERAIVDLHGRHNLDLLRFAKTLGLTPTAASARAAEVADRWATTLDPGLLARLGPGECAGLADVLAGHGLALPPVVATEPAADEAPGEPDAPTTSEPAGPPSTLPSITLAGLLAAAPDVSGHAEGCDACSDRSRAMVSVEDLVNRAPLETAPPAVRVVLRGSGRRHRPSSPPSIEPGARRRRPRLTMVVAIVAAVAGIGAATATLVVDRLGRTTQGDRVRALTELPKVNALAADPSAIVVPGGTFTLFNRSTRPLRWQADSPTPWLAVDPGSGTLSPGGQRKLRVGLRPGAPADPADLSIVVTGDDGSATAVAASTSGVGGPSVDATLVGCAVTANAVAPAGVAAVTLHWRQLPPVAPGPVPSTAPSTRRVLTTDTSGPARPAAVEHDTALIATRTDYAAFLPALTAPIQWWVTVDDVANDEVQSPVHTLPPGSCG